VRGTVFSGTVDYGWMAVTGIYSPSGTLPYDCTGITVAVIDSGIHDRDDLKDPGGHSRIVYKESFVSADDHPDDFYGHAVHVIGIIAGNGKKSTGNHYGYRIRGIVPNANIVSLRVLDKYGLGTDSAVIAAIQRAIQLKSRYNIRVINLSLGRPVYGSYQNDPLCQAVEQAWKAGIVVVAAAGNDGRDNSAGTQDTLPSLHRETIHT
jgi:serine protease AprX